MTDTEWPSIATIRGDAHEHRMGYREGGLGIGKREVGMPLARYLWKRAGERKESIPQRLARVRLGPFNLYLLIAGLFYLKGIEKGRFRP